MNRTKIEWTDMSLNPVVGCTHGCLYCYARRFAKRQGKDSCCYNFFPHPHQIVAKNDQAVFCRLDGTPIKGFNTAWRSICKLSGLENFYYHDLRHTFCSNLLLSGSDIKDVKEMIGHSDLSMTDRYSHLTLKHRQSRQIELAKHYSTINNRSGL